MKKSVSATVASVLSPPVSPPPCLGLAGPAAADSTHHDWIHDIQQQASVGVVTSTVGNGR